MRGLGFGVAGPGRAWRAAVVGALLTLTSPAVALAASPTNPFSPGLPQSPSSVPTTTASPPITTPQTTTTAGSSGLSGSGTLVIAIGALVILGGISFFIWRDARRRAPVRARGAIADDAGGGSRSGSKSRAKPRKLSAAERRRRKRGRARR